MSQTAAALTTSNRKSLNGAKAPSEVTTIRPRVHWTKPEWTIVAETFRDLRSTNPKMGVEVGCKQAMQILPEPRRRPFTSGLATKVQNVVKKLKPKPVIAPSVAPEEPAVKAEPPIAATTFNSSEDTVTPGETVVHELSIMLATIFATALAHGTVQEAIRNTVRGIMGAPITAAEATEQWPEFTPIAGVESKRRLPRVLVGGLGQAQREAMLNRFRDRFDLRFWSLDNSKDQLRVMSSRADACIGWCGGLSHTHTDIMRSRTKRFILCKGGVSSITEAIESLAPRLSEAANGAAH